MRKEPMVAALSKEHPLASKTSSDLIELANDPFILTGRNSNQSHYDGIINSCYDAGFSPNIIQETKEMSTVISLVSAGIGIAIVPASIQLLLQNEVVYRDIRDNKFNTVTALVWENKNQTPIVNAFVELVKESVIPIFNKYECF
ncbi:LysR substrate-binding domain-containing protein [Priestia aryabhattai]|uniref:LysR substrate-binding domain-containing protein n=1 Tax=Priestia aryabhattai TaxID=412384 RepID=UPI0039A05548